MAKGRAVWEGTTADSGRSDYEGIGIGETVQEEVFQSLNVHRPPHLRLTSITSKGNLFISAGDGRRRQAGGQSDHVCISRNGAGNLIQC